MSSQSDDRSTVDHPSSQPGVNFSKIIPLTLIGIGLMILGFVAVTALVKVDPPVTDSVIPSSVNFPAPDFTLNNLKGDKITLSNYRPKIVLINNWATWCPPCKSEMPTLVKYYDEHRDQGFVLVGINAGDPSTDVAKFVDDFGLTFPILLDPNDRSLSAFHNDSLPSSYVIDQNGTVVLAWTGPINRAMLEKYLTPLLEQ